MKKLIQMCVASAIVLCASACGNFTGGEERKIDGAPYRETANGSWGILDVETGKPIYEDEFYNQPSYAINGVFFVQEGDESRYSLYKIDGKTPKGIAGDLLGVGFCNDGLIPIVRQDSRIALINDKGETKVELLPYEGKEITSCLNMFSSGLLAVKCDGKWGAVNTKGEMVIEPEYQYMSLFYNNRAIALKKIEQEGREGFEEYKYLIIDGDGKEIAAFDVYDDRYPEIEEGVWLYRSDSDKRFVDMKTGKVLCKVNKNEDIRSFNSKYYVSKEDGQVRVYNYDKERVARGDYSRIILFNDDMFYAQKSRDKGYWLNHEGERIETLDDWNDMYCYCNLRTVEVDGEEVLLNEKGEIISEEYHYIGAKIRTDNLVSDYFDADAELAKLMGQVDFKNGSCGDITIGMTAEEVAAKHSDKMNRTNTSEFNCTENGSVHFAHPYIVARYVTKTREGYWGPETYQEQDGYEWNNTNVTSIWLQYCELSKKKYRLKGMFAKFCEDIQKHGYSCTETYDEFGKIFENDKYRVNVYLDDMEGGYVFAWMKIKLYAKD